MVGARTSSRPTCRLPDCCGHRSGLPSRELHRERPQIAPSESMSDPTSLAKSRRVSTEQCRSTINIRDYRSRRSRSSWQPQFPSLKTLGVHVAQSSLSLRNTIVSAPALPNFGSLPWGISTKYFQVPPSKLELRTIPSPPIKLTLLFFSYSLSSGKFKLCTSIFGSLMDGRSLI